LLLAAVTCEEPCTALFFGSLTHHGRLAIVRPGPKRPQGSGAGEAPGEDSMKEAKASDDDDGPG